jgi:FAD/FMN-containing dehydrogenase/enamine deaminase RidA (YjgF/YER057c/UK114 family)
MERTTTDLLVIDAQGPLDTEGRLVHEDDLPAQLALALANVAGVLHDRGLDWPHLTRLRVRTTDLARTRDVFDIVTEHLDAVGAAPETSLVEVNHLPVLGMTVSIDAEARRPLVASVTTTPRRKDMTSTILPSADSLDQLDFVHRPGDPDYEELRAPWNAAVDQQPAAVALPRTAEQVAAVVRAAAAAGFRVAPQGTGHGAGLFSGADLHDVVLLRTVAMTDVLVDPVGQVARVQSGAVWQDVVEAAAPHGLAALHGSSPDVGVAGYTLGGGIGWYARKHGLATNSLVAVELVTAAGELVRADEQENPDLFWAVRGGGGSFGVVTALELRLLPITDAYAGMLLWDLEHAEPVLRRWAAWSAAAPDEVTTSYRIMRFPPMPELPDFLRGRSLVVVDGAVLGDDDFGAAQIAGLRELGPEMDTFARTPAPALSRLHMDPEGPTPNVGGSTLLGTLDEDVIRAFLDAAGPGTPTTLLVSELRQLGGALGRPHPGGGALSHIAGEYVAFFVGIAAGPELMAMGEADLDRVLATLAPHATGTSYLNFAERPVDLATAFGPEAWERLRDVRTDVDPSGLFVANHPVPPRT